VAWHLNPALSRMRAEVNARWPNRDRTSDGTIGDAAHRGRRSDHNPDPDGSVDAWDMDVNGVDVAGIKAAFERHEAASYWIHNDRIALRSEGWRPRSYSYAGPNRNRHTRHVHFNSRESHENSRKPWGIDVSAKEVWTEDGHIANWPWRTDAGTNPKIAGNTAIWVAGDQAHKAAVASAATRLAAEATLAAVRGSAGDTDAILARINEIAEQLTVLPAEVAEAITDPGRSPAETADALRSVLGDRSAEVGRILADPA
jgi:hypothetical protein